MDDQLKILGGYRQAAVNPPQVQGFSGRSVDGALDGGEAELQTQSKRAVISAFLGFFVDMFDIFLPVIALAPAQKYFQPDDVPASAIIIAESLIVASTLIGRPVGSVLFGYVSDRIGRRPTTLITLTGFGVCIILMGLLPGYRTWGMASLYMLIALRFISGCFLGGEYSGANVLAMETAPREKRGPYSGIIQSGYPLAFVAISALTFLMLAIFPSGSPDSPYAVYGWRIPFFIGGALALGFIVPFRKTVKESPAWEATRGKRAGIGEVLSGKAGRRLAQVCLVILGFWFTTFSAQVGMLPAELIHVIHLKPAQMTITIMVASAFLTVGYLLVAVLSQYLGRRFMIALMAILTGTAGLYAYYLLLSAPGKFSTIVVLATIVVVLLTSVWGVTTCYLVENFPTRVRAAAFGIAFGVPVIIPSLYGTYQGFLARIVPEPYTVLLMTGFGALCMLVGALIGNEGKDVDLKLLS